MPPSQVSDAEMEPLTRFLRGLEPRDVRRAVVREKVPTTDGKTLEGEILNQGFDDLQMRTGDGRVHLLRRAATAFAKSPRPPIGPATMATLAATGTPRCQRSPKLMWRDWDPGGCSLCPTRRAYR